MKKPPAVPTMKEGSKIKSYVIACHLRIWKLLNLVEPELVHTGDCLVEADRILNGKSDQTKDMFSVLETRPRV